MHEPPKWYGKPSPWMIEKHTLTPKEIARFTEVMRATYGASYYDTPNSHVALRRVLDEREQ